MNKKETVLRAQWSTKDNDITFFYPSRKSDAHMLHCFFDGVSFKDDSGAPRSLYQLLDARGFDVKTLRFSIKKKVLP